MERGGLANLKETVGVEGEHGASGGIVCVVAGVITAWITQCSKINPLSYWSQKMSC